MELNNNMKFKFRIYKVHKMLIIIEFKKIEKMNKLGYWLAKEKKMKNKKVFQIVNQHLNKSLLIIFTKYQ